MSVVVGVALYGWIPLAMMLCACLPARQAVLVCLIGGWLFMPVAGYDLPGPLDWTKANVTGLAVLLGACIFDSERLRQYRPCWFDVPAFVFCLWPGVSAGANGLTAPGDMMTPVLQHSLSYGVPYILGRVYFKSVADARELSFALIVGGLIYVPLCLYEIRMSPQLHSEVYGFHQHVFVQSKRGGGAGGRLSSCSTALQLACG